MKTGRPATGQGKSVYIPLKYLPSVMAIKSGDLQKAIEMLREFIKDG